MDILLKLPTWSPSSVPASTTLKSIASSFAPGALETLSLGVEQIQKISDTAEIGKFITLSRDIRGAQATLTIISAEQVLATATDSSVQAKATQAIFDATLNLADLAQEENFYSIYLNRFGNVWYLVIFSIIMLYLMGMLSKSRYWWFNITFVCGYALEWMGFLGRVLAFTDDTDQNFFLLQYISLTIAPAFIMAGIYFVFAQLVVIHGRHFSVLKPLWYSYMFITFDVVSLIIQAGGGGAASTATTEHRDPTPGTNTMIAGIAFQVFGMTIFLVFWFEFLNRIYFKEVDSKNGYEVEHQKFAKKSVKNYLRLLFNVPSVRNYRRDHLDQYYSPQFAKIRHGKLFDWFPLGITIAVLAVYVRSVYRVVELAQGFDGFLITHEVFLFTLDAMMIATCGLIFIPLHPVWVLGKEVPVRLATIRKNQDTKEELSDDGSETNVGIC